MRELQYYAGRHNSQNMLKNMQSHNHIFPGGLANCPLQGSNPDLQHT